MGRKLKVQPGQVAKFLKENNGPTPVYLLAEFFDCTPATIRKRIRTLRDEGTSILPTRLGLLDAAKVPNDAMARLIKHSCEWTIAGICSLAAIAAVSKQPLIQARKRFEAIEDRRDIKAMLLTLARIVDSVDLDHQLGE